MIYQHFQLVPSLTVTENIILGIDQLWNFKPLNLQQKQKEIAALSQKYQLEIDPTAKIQNLPVGVQQRVEILKVLYRQAKLLILDEPTAVLTPQEAKTLITILRQLANQGNTIIFISHKLSEVMSLCDHVTVLRRGKVIKTIDIQSTTNQELAELMVGKEVSSDLQKPPLSLGNLLLTVENLKVADDRGVNVVRSINFQLREGEILGVAGVDGNGQRELADAIAGLRIIKDGKIEFHSENNQSVKIGYIPEDRQKMGLVLDFNIGENLILKVFKNIPFVKNFLLQNKVIKDNAKSVISTFDVRTKSENVQVGNLSGGNQQKVVLGRELAEKPDLIIAMQPTRGLDVGATELVQEKLLNERERGAGILYISTELEEVMKISDRIAVIYQGEFIDILDVNTATIEEVSLLMGGGKNVS